MANKRPKVSWEGIPFGSSKKVFNHSSLSWPKRSISACSMRFPKFHEAMGN